MAPHAQPLDALKHRVLKSAVIVERVDEHGDPVEPRGLKWATSRLGQMLAERGRTPPWAMSRQQCQQFWASRIDGSNGPPTYVAKPTGVVDFLNAFWTPEVGPGDHVLELGCNAGTNLNRLRELGFERLSGVEINPHALGELRRVYPELAERSELVQGSLESELAAMEDSSVDVAFSMAVLIHLHPSSVRVFDDLVRVSRRYVCVVELERASNSYVFPRDYGRVFSRRGCTQLRSARITRRGYPDVSRAYDGYVARLFRTPTG
jgi:SAM-dependent methyltransferase